MNASGLLSAVKICVLDSGERRRSDRFAFNLDEQQAIVPRILGLNVVTRMLVCHLARLPSESAFRIHDGSHRQPVNPFTIGGFGGSMLFLRLTAPTMLAARRAPRR